MVLIVKTDELEQEVNTFILQGVLMEYPLEMVREYMKKYARKSICHERDHPIETTPIQQ